MSKRKTRKQDPAKAVKVLYIVGVGRSGSTILDIVLGNSPYIQGVGELTYMFSEGFIKGEKCSCGMPPDKCDFFSKVRARYFDITKDRDYTGYEHVRNRMERLWMLPIVLMGLVPRMWVSKYRRRTEAMYQAISEVGGKPIIVDSSKRPGRLVALAYCHNVEVIPIHLVRDGRGYIWSSMKRQKRIGFDSKEVFSEKRSLVKSMGIWLLINMASLIALFAYRMKTGQKENIVLRYDHFCENPIVAIKQISKILGFEEKNLLLDLNINKSFKPYHKIGGNMTKYNESVYIRYDSEWKTKLGVFHNIIYYLIGWPLHVIYHFYH